MHKNVCQGCHKIRKSESKKAMQPLHSIKVVLCDIKSYFFLKKSLDFYNIQHATFLSKLNDKKIQGSKKLKSWGVSESRSHNFFFFFL